MADSIEKPAEDLRPSKDSPSTLNLRSLERIQRLLQYAALLVLLVFVGLIVLSYFQLRAIKREIGEQQAKIQQQKQEIEENEKTLENRKKLISGLQANTLACTEANPSEGANIRETVEKSIAEVSDAKQLPPRIYIQIAREDQRRRAAAVARALQAAGYIVPGIENVRGKAPTNTQLRYCGADNWLQADLDGIVNALERISVPVTRQRLANCGNVRPRHYEIWFGESY
jgi:septal ring factor EnvC (AmiA/AmiB activator)